jgi:hypothetical protein
MSARPTTPVYFDDHFLAAPLVVFHSDRRSPRPELLDAMIYRRALLDATEL